MHRKEGEVPFHHYDEGPGVRMYLWGYFNVLYGYCEVFLCILVCIVMHYCGVVMFYCGYCNVFLLVLWCIYCIVRIFCCINSCYCTLIFEFIYYISNIEAVESYFIRLWVYADGCYIFFCLFSCCYDVIKGWQMTSYFTSCFQNKQNSNYCQYFQIHQMVYENLMDASHLH